MRCSKYYSIYPTVTQCPTMPGALSYPFSLEAMSRHTRESSLLAAVLVVLLPLSVAAGDTLAAGDSINHTESLVSSEGKFKLGFFTPSQSNLLYLGIWFNRDPTAVAVWVANRRQPLPGSSAGVLTMAENGTLVLSDKEGKVYWSTEVSGTDAGHPPVARLLDTGNLVVDTGNLAEDTGEGYAWQSFDHPSDTLLPGMKLGYDYRRGVDTNFTAWRGDGDPAPGECTLVMDRRGDPQMLVLRGGAPGWRAGPWVGRQFSGVPDMRPYGPFNYSFVSNDDGLYYRYEVWDKSWMTRVVVNSSGALQHFLWFNVTARWELIWWSPADRCDVYNVCGPNTVCGDGASPVGCNCLPGFKPKSPEDWAKGSTAAGCASEAAASGCRNGKGEFRRVANLKLPDTAAVAVHQSVGMEECKAACLRNCSCTALASSGGGDCVTWSGELADARAYADGQGQELYVRVVGTTYMKKKKPVLIVVLSITLAALLTLIYIYSQRQVIKKRLKCMQDITDSYHHDENSEAKDLEVKMFQFSTIESATNNFSLKNLLGEGGFGPVYKGTLNGREEVAVKRLSKSSNQGLEEYKSEIQLVAKLQHTNLVRLLGCCIEAEEKILVYEYMPNQSLDKFIFDPNMGVQLDWVKRLHIIEGITQGLLYLHKYSRLRVIHRDLKASNILLDNEWNPKISDFGLARIFAWNDSQVNTNRIVGTYGYMPPEYAMKGIFSVKSDVFSFGVLLLEILSGKRNTSIEHFGISSNLMGYAWRFWREGRELELIDPELGSTSLNYQISRSIHIALLCVQENPMDRPTMFDVASMLNNETIILPNPNQPAFFLENHIIDVVGGQSCTNDVTITEVQCR